MFDTPSHSNIPRGRSSLRSRNSREGQYSGSAKAPDDPASASRIRLNLREYIPKMSETNFSLDDYLFIFEKVAHLFKWPITTSVSYLVPQFNPKCMEIYARAPITKSSDYDWLKVQLYDKYDIGIETHRRKFYHLSRLPAESFKDLGYRVIQLFDRWWDASQIT